MMMSSESLSRSLHACCARRTGALRSERPAELTTVDTQGMLGW
jgi:hypothetical protein